MKLHSILAALVLGTFTVHAPSAAVTGNAAGQWVSPKSSVGSIVATPTAPEHEPYALMLAGMVAMGALIGRRVRRR